MQAGINHVKAKILAAVPSAGEGEVGGLFDAYGSATWAPSRAAKMDFSAWGRWEAWEHQEILLGTPRVTGDWVAWDSSSGQQIGFATKEKLSAREQAEMMAVFLNEGGQTRVVSASGSFRKSGLKHADVAKELAPRLRALKGGLSDEEYLAEVESHMERGPLQ